MNTTIKPFDDVNVRKAVIAGFDREAMRLTRGGELVGDIPTHFIPPGMPGFEEAGGLKGPGVDFMSQPDGRHGARRRVLQEGGLRLRQVRGRRGAADGRRRPRASAQKAAEVAKEQFEKLGFKVRLRPGHAATRCTRSSATSPTAKVAICPNVGWLKDFADAADDPRPDVQRRRTSSRPSNSNWSQLDDPELNEEMDKAKLADRSAGARRGVGRRSTRRSPSSRPPINWIWDKTPQHPRRTNVNGVVDEDNALWALAYTSLK